MALPVGSGAVGLGWGPGRHPPMTLALQRWHTTALAKGPPFSRILPDAVKKHPWLRELTLGDLLPLGSRILIQCSPLPFEWRHLSGERF